MSRKFSTDSSTDGKKRSTSQEPRKRKIQRPGGPIAIDVNVDVPSVLTQISSFSPRALPSPARSLPTPSHHALMTPQAFCGPTTSRNIRFPITFPEPDEPVVVERQADLSELTNLLQLSTQNNYFQGQQYKHQQQQQDLLARQQLDQLQQLTQMQTMMEQQALIQQAEQQQALMRTPEVPQMTQFAQLQRAQVFSTPQAAAATAQPTAPATATATTTAAAAAAAAKMPLASEERKLLSAIEGHLLDNTLNMYVGSMPVVKVQDFIKENLTDCNEAVIKQKHSGSFHNFIKSHSDKFRIFYYSDEEITSHQLNHCNTHEGRLHFADVNDDICKKRDYKTAVWKAGLVNEVLGEVERIIRQRPIQMKILMMRFKEETEDRYCAVASSNHALRALLKKRPDRFIVLQDSTVKLAEQVTPQELEEWKQKQADKDRKGGKKANSARKKTPTPSAHTSPNSTGISDYSPQSQASLYSPPQAYFSDHTTFQQFTTPPTLPLGYDSSAMSTPVSMPQSFQATPQFSTQIYQQAPHQTQFMQGGFIQKQMLPQPLHSQIPVQRVPQQVAQPHYFEQFTQA